jgi:hypothetical protein
VAPPFGHRLILLPGAPEDAADGHRDVTGGWLRPAVFGAMDGLVTNSSLIAGVGGGGGRHSAIVLTGVAGLIAGAFSMATGEYISVQSQNELAEAEIEREKRRHTSHPSQKLDRLTDIFIDKGVSRTWPRPSPGRSRPIPTKPWPCICGRTWASTRTTCRPRGPRRSPRSQPSPSARCSR